jgi:hypothetical protein
MTCGWSLRRFRRSAHSRRPFPSRVNPTFLFECTDFATHRGSQYRYSGPVIRGTFRQSPDVLTVTLKVNDFGRQMMLMIILQHTTRSLFRSDRGDADDALIVVAVCVCVTTSISQ